MNRNAVPSDVFLAAAPSDKRLAEGLADTLRQYAIAPFLPPEAPPGKAFADAIPEAVAECRALILLVGPSGLTNRMPVEIGAVQDLGQADLLPPRRRRHRAHPSI